MSGAVSLVVLAAGRSTRFGRPKQLEPVGPKGEALLDITIADALVAGCSDVVIVVRPEHLDVFRTRFAERENTRLVVQPEALGTAHAAMFALRDVHTAAVLVNADDHYGTGPIRIAVEHAINGASNEHALVAFALANTLSAAGGVNRAICEVGDRGYLNGTREVIGLRKTEDDRAVDQEGREYAADVPVSMNLWVLRPIVFALFPAVFAQHHQGEFGLPTLVHEAIRAGLLFKVLHTTEAWCGLTYAADTELVRQRLAARDK